MIAAPQSAIAGTWTLQGNITPAGARGCKALRRAQDSSQSLSAIAQLPRPDLRCAEALDRARRACPDFSDRAQPTSVGPEQRRGHFRLIFRSTQANTMVPHTADRDAPQFQAQASHPGRAADRAELAPCCSKQVRNSDPVARLQKTPLRHPPG